MCGDLREDELGFGEMREGLRRTGTRTEEGEFLACRGQDQGGEIVKDLLLHHAKESELAS